jgi:hypothetical protein
MTVWVRGLAIALFGAVALGGCGSDDGDDGETGGGAGAPASGQGGSSRQWRFEWRQQRLRRQ